MNHRPTNGLSRRDFGKRVGQIAAASAMVGLAVPNVYAASSDTIQVALVGCGGRGTGAVTDVLRVPGERTRLVAMADTFKDKLDGSYKTLSDLDEFGER